MNEGQAPDDPRFLSVTDAARRLGMGRTRLYELAREHEVFQASVKGLPETDMGKRTVRYHVAHLRILEAVLLEVYSCDEGLTRWKLHRSRMAEFYERRG